MHLDLDAVTNIHSKHKHLRNTARGVNFLCEEEVLNMQTLSFRESWTQPLYHHFHFMRIF